MNQTASLLCTVVMPAYNEEGCIAQLVAGWTQELQRVLGERFNIVIVNDGSRDKTGVILDTIAKANPFLTVHHQVNQGHGAAVLNGYRLAVDMNSEYVFQTDSDNQFEPGDFVQLWNLRAESDFILGYRQQRHDALHRLVISKIAAILISLIFGVRIIDSNVPFRLMKTAYLKTLLPIIPQDTFVPNICLSVAAARRGQKLLHIPVHHKERKTGTVSIVKWRLIKACFRSLLDLLRFRLNGA